MHMPIRSLKGLRKGNILLYVSQLLLVSLLTLQLQGCSGALPALPAVEIKIVEKEFFHPSRPSPLDLSAPKFEVITSDVAEAMNKQVEAGEILPYTYVRLSWEEYIKLGQNMKEIIKKFHEQSALLCHYRRDIREPECERYLSKNKEKEKD